MRRLGVVATLLLLAALVPGRAGALAKSAGPAGRSVHPNAAAAVRLSAQDPEVGGDSCTGDANRPGSGGPQAAGASAATASAASRSSASASAGTGSAATSQVRRRIHPDFNGDGFADLAIAVVCEDVGSVADAGAVNVIYGGPNGLDANAGPGNQWWTQDSPGILDQAESLDQFGHVMTPGDFNRDGYDDLAIASREDLEGSPTIQDAGAINIIYGGPNGLDANAGPGNQFWTLNSPGLPGHAASGDLFGRALAAGDFNRDSYQDLAIGIPNRDGPTGVVDSGAMIVLNGSAAGLTTNRFQQWTQDTPGMNEDGREYNDQFARALSAADFNGDGYVDLAIGPRHESLENPDINQAGEVEVLYGSNRGLSVGAGPGAQTYTEDTPGLAGTGAAASDWWGRPLKSGDFNGDGYADLAIGTFLKDVNGKTDAGAVNVIYGSANGLDLTAGPGNQFWNQDSTGILDDVEAKDWFSRWDAVADFNGDGYADLVCGEPGEDIGTGQDRIDSAGAVNVIYGGPNGLDANAGPGNQFWDQDSTGIQDQAEVHDWFAHGNEVGADFNGDGLPDLAIGVIFEDLEGSPTVVDAGAVNVIYGSSAGLDANAGPGNQFWNENSPGIAGDGAEFSDVYGGTLAAPGGD